MYTKTQNLSPPGFRIIQCNIKGIWPQQTFVFVSQNFKFNWLASSYLRGFGFVTFAKDEEVNACQFSQTSHHRWKNVGKVLVKLKVQFRRRNSSHRIVHQINMSATSLCCTHQSKLNFSNWIHHLCTAVTKYFFELERKNLENHNW